MRAAVLVVATAAVAAGCSIGSGAATSGRPSTGATTGAKTTLLTHYRGHGVAFDYPATWGRYRRGGVYSTMTSPVVDLSTQHMVDPCTHVANRTTCALPVHHMRAGGVVVVWQAWDGFGALMHHPPGPVHVRVVRGGCRDIGGDEIIAAQIATRHHKVFLANACLRGPGIAANERAFRSMVRSAVATT
jgi:hypothetical protein